MFSVSVQIWNPGNYKRPGSCQSLNVKYKMTHHLLVTTLVTLLVTLLTTGDGFENCTASPLHFQYATPLELAKFLVGTGVSVDPFSVVFSGNINNETETQVAKYFGGATIFDNIDDMDQGVVLTTGNVNQPLCQSQLMLTEPHPNPDGASKTRIDSFSWPIPTPKNINPDLIATCEQFYTTKGMNTANCAKYQDQAELSFTFSINTRTTIGIVGFFLIFFSFSSFYLLLLVQLLLQ